MDTHRIGLRGVHGFGFHGVFPDEKRVGQDFYVDVDIETNFSQAIVTDSVEATIDYGVAAQMIHDAISGPSYDLIESLASAIADLLLTLPTATKVRVRVYKPQAPIAVPFENVFVEIERELHK